MDDTFPEVPNTQLETEILELALRLKRANGPVMKLVNLAGSAIESAFSKVPVEYHLHIEKGISQALEASYGIAGRTPELGSRGSLAAVLASGAAGGAGGLPSAIAELPVTVTLILNAIRVEAKMAGFDPDEDRIRAECLQVFGAGSPLASDDGINTSFIAARLSVSGQAVQSLITKIVPKLASALGPKLVAQAIPVLGAVSGAALNAAFLNYYQEIARIRFRLLKLADVYGAEPVLDAFKLAVTPPKVIKA